LQHNKKREELHRLKEKYPEVAAKLEARRVIAESDGDETLSSSDEEEDDGFISAKTEAQILNTLLKIRNRDESIYDKETKFYSSEEEEGEDQDGGKNSKPSSQKPLYLKDMVYREAMHTAAGGGLESDDEGLGSHKQSKENVKSYQDEQKELKDAFLQAFQEDVEAITAKDGDLLQQKRGPLQHIDSDGEENDVQIQHLLDAYFSNKQGEGKDVNEDDQFLKDYISQRKWIGDENGGNGSDAEDVEEDEAALEAAEAYEAEYNFRFEEPGGTSLVTHPRQLEGIVRKEDDKRKRKRAEKAQRKAEEEEGRRTELKRLKNLKKGEIMNKLSELQAVAGAAAPKAEVLDQLLGGDFDPEAHDRAMAEAFGDEYYGMDEEEEDMEDEIFEKEFAVIADYDSDDDQAQAKETFAAALEKKMRNANADPVSGKEDQESREDLKRLVEEYHKLDYEDFVGGIPTRFRYKEVEPETYGLTIEEILAMEDKELNQIIGLKNVAATYRTDGKRMRPNYGKLNELRKDRRSDDDQKSHKRKAAKKRFEHHPEPNTSIGDEQVPNIDKKVDEVNEKKKTSRLASFVPPSLKKQKKMDPSKKRSKVLPRSNGEKLQVDPLAGLTKAQKKNMKRAAKRAAKRTGGPREG
jgi:protein KRI1